MQERLKDILALSGLFFLVVTSIQFYSIFFMALLNKIQYNVWTVTVSFNTFNEAIIEGFVYIIVLPLVCYCLYKYTNDFSIRYNFLNREPKRMSRLGSFSFWTLIVFLTTIGICMLILGVLNQ